MGKPWADAMARYLGQAAEHGYSMFDVPYGSMPSLLKGDQFQDSMFVLMWRDVEGWVKLRMDPNLKSGEDVVCHPAFFQKLQEAGHSPMDVRRHGSSNTVTVTVYALAPRARRRASQATCATPHSRVDDDPLR